MREDLLRLMYRIFCLSLFLEAVYSALDLDESSDAAALETPRLVGDLADHPEEVQEAMTKWMQSRGCELADVPIILAAEAYIGELAGELQRVFYREKTGIIVADGGFRWLLERLADRYETESSLADHLHVEMFTQLPGMIRRAKRVRPLLLGQTVPVGLGRRYKEAGQSYLAGHPVACCVLCRAVVEAALKETLERIMKAQVNLDYVTLRDLIDRSSKLLPHLVVQSCRRVKALGDKAVHREDMLTLDEAYQALIATQHVLKSVFVESTKPSEA